MRQGQKGDTSSHVVIMDPEKDVLGPSPTVSAVESPTMSIKSQAVEMEPFHDCWCRADGVLRGVAMFDFLSIRLRAGALGIAVPCLCLEESIESPARSGIGLE